MSTKKLVLLILSLSFCGISFLSLIYAMILNAVFADESVIIPVIVAMVSIASSFAAIVALCLYGKGEKQ
ncbi:MAG: hypothetical protein IJ725_01425 [Ruminococcus sp.]|nr:hypothetical protein [Ruminococcus sp.]